MLRSNIFKVVLFLFLTSFSCDKEDKHISINLVNNTEKSFYAISSYSSPDTSIGSYNVSADILSNTTSKIYSKVGWVQRIETIEDKTLIIFLIDKDTFAVYSTSDIQENYRISKRYDLTVDELDSLGWTITYP